MKFNKILLATAIAAASTSAFAMEAMDEASLSSTTGQDGLTVNIANDLGAFDVILHDKNGFTGNTSAGAIVIKGIDLGAMDVTATIDAGATGASTTDTALNIAITNNTNLSVNLGTLRVANSNRDNSGGWGTSDAGTAVLSLGTVTVSSGNLMNIQLGNEPQGAFVKLNAVLSTGLTLTGFTILDAGGSVSGGGIKTDLSVTNAGGGALNTAIDIDANTSGLVMTVNTLGTGGMDVHMSNLIVGNVGASPTPAIGDVEIVGLNLAGTAITVSGH